MSAPGRSGSLTVGPLAAMGRQRSAISETS